MVMGTFTARTLTALLHQLTCIWPSNNMTAGNCYFDQSIAIRKLLFHATSHLLSGLEVSAWTYYMHGQLSFRDKINVTIQTHIPAITSSLSTTIKCRCCICSRYCAFTCIVKHSAVPLPALHSSQSNNLIWLSRTLAHVMGQYFANELSNRVEKGMKLR